MQRDDLNHHFDFELHPLDSRTDNTACPVVGLLVLALRLGQVHGTTLEQVIDHALARNDRTIVWREPGLPVLPALKGPDWRQLDLQKACVTDRIRNVVERAGLLAGIVVKVIPHALRRGHAKDVASLDRKNFRGATTHEVAQTMGQTYVSFSKGITQNYVGNIEDHVWNAKAEGYYTTTFSPKVSDNVLDTRKRKFTTAEIEEYAVKLGLDPRNDSHRRKAGYKLKAKTVEEWRATEQENGGMPTAP